MRLPRTAAMLFCVALPLPIPAAAQPARPAPSAQRDYAALLGGYIDRLRSIPGAPPGTVVLVTHRGRTLFARAYGVRDVSSGAPMTLDTPVYNGSVTKAYTGLLAAMLDADGTLSLDTSITDAWPALRPPAGIDSRAVTARRLLSHSAPINADGLSYRTVVTGEGIGVDGLVHHLATHVRARAPGFDYSNSGPVIWAAMAETRTGLHWRDLLRRRVLAPLGMTRTTGRTEDFPRGELALCHARSGGRWLATDPKPTLLMSAAGGMFASGNDTARFIQLFATDGASARGRIPAAILRRTWQQESVQDTNIFGTHRDGYGLGWDLGTVLGQRFVSRSGGYVGCRSMALFLPESGLGVVVLTNGDAAANTHNSAIFTQAIDLWLDAAGARERGAQRIASYHAAAAQEMARVDAADPRLAQVRPLEPAAQRAIAGRYVNDRLGTIEATAAGTGVALRLGIARGQLLWTGGDSFIAAFAPDPSYEAFQLERDPAGAPVALIFDDDRYVRKPG